MPNRTLSPNELLNANALLVKVRARLKSLAGGDSARLFAYRRKIYKELTCDERGKPRHRKTLTGDLFFVLREVPPCGIAGWRHVALRQEYAGGAQAVWLAPGVRGGARWAIPGAHARRPSVAVGTSTSERGRWPTNDTIYIASRTLTRAVLGA